jgi:NAD(P)-dependent dehydrogenase (short-subunit alcohol dehydrogenase family)
MPRTMEHADTTVSPAAPPHDPAAPPHDSGQRALVVGASSGIGAALVRELVRRGYRVAALARRSGELEELRRAAPERVVTRVHDVHDVAAVPGLFEELVRELGGLDLFAYVAGVMPKVGPLEVDTAKDLEILAVNTLGAIAWCNPAAEHFQSKRAGVIVGVGSIAGDRGRRPQPVYGASKAAFAHYLEALRNRLSEHGVRVCTIKPGYVDTPMTAGLPLKGAVSADAAARTIVGYARRGSGVRYVPLKWLLVSLVVRSIPSRIFRHLQI